MQLGRRALREDGRRRAPRQKRRWTPGQAGPLVERPPLLGPRRPPQISVPCSPPSAGGGCMVGRRGAYGSTACQRGAVRRVEAPKTSRGLKSGTFTCLAFSGRGEVWFLSFWAHSQFGHVPVPYLHLCMHASSVRESQTLPVLERRTTTNYR